MRISIFRVQGRLSKWVLKKLECTELVIIEIISQEDRLKLECTVSLLFPSAPRLAKKSTRSFQNSPQCEGTQQKSRPIPLDIMQWIKN